VGANPTDVASSRLLEIFQHLRKIFLFALDDVIAVLLFGESVGFDVLDIRLECLDIDLGHIAVFFYELGRKGLKLANQIGDDQQLAVGLQTSANAIHGDGQFFGYKR
jgi:hypothetical protein